jgi:HSP20 family protein
LGAGARAELAPAGDEQAFQRLLRRPARGERQRRRTLLRADLPGVEEKDVKIELEDNVLTISGERKAEHEQRDEGYYRIERAHGQFARSLTLPEGVNAEGIVARFDRGVLEVKIPKPEQRKPHRVTIGVSGAGAADDGTVEGSES